MVAAVLHLHEGARAALDRVDHVGGGLAHAHDVVDADLLECVDAEIRQARDSSAAFSFSSLPSTRSTSSIVGEIRGLGLRRAAGDDDAGFRVLAPRLADRLAGLAHGLAGHRAGVEDDGAAIGRQPGLFGLAAHDFGFVGVEPAAEGDDVETPIRPRLLRIRLASRHAPVAGIERAGKFPFGRGRS